MYSKSRLSDIMHAGISPLPFIVCFKPILNKHIIHIFKVNKFKYMLGKRQSIFTHFYL